MLIIKYIKEHKRILFLCTILIVIFLLLRLPGISLSYYQDEWKNISASESAIGAGSFFAHPPFMQMFFVISNNIFGANNFRFSPLIFSLASLFLLYLVAKNRYGQKTALYVLALYTICFYGVWGSLIADIDGSILPFFFLLSVYTYDKWAKAPEISKWKWFVLLIITCLGGFLLKLSFVLVIGTLLADFLWNNRKGITFKDISKYVIGTFVFGLIYIVLLYFIQFIYPAFNIGFMLGHAEAYAGNIGRNWIQIVIQAVKAIFYLSPLLLIPIVFIDKEIFRKTRLFSIYLLFGFIFYFVIFDFSRGALDKYLMFSIVPLAIVIGTIISKFFSVRGHNEKNQIIRSIIFGLGICIILLASNFLDQTIPALYPKEEWFGKVIYLQWNFLNPFNGGSGPLGFYVSFFFIVMSYISSAIVGIIAFFEKEWRKEAMIILILIGLTYNGVFIEELLFGKINGNSSKVTREAVSFIINSKDINGVITYNDIGAYELYKAGKYIRRFYAIPQSEEGYKKVFSDNVEKGGGYFLVVNIPRISEKSFYMEFLVKCNIAFQAEDKKITATVYSCKTP
jgi:hypothetical protein